MTFSHEVWSNDTYCPVHGVSPVGVEIIEDGDLPSLTIKDATVNEGNEANFVVELSEASDETVTVSYATSDGTAEAGHGQGLHS